MYCILAIQAKYTTCTSMLPLDNEHVNNLETILHGDPFKDVLVDQIVKARDSIFNEMCSEMGISDFQNVRDVYLNKRNITKDKLISWLETVCFILDTYSVPLLKNAVTVAERADDLKEEKISDQKSIIELQQKLIEKKDAELNNVQKTVQTEMKTYSSVVSKSCAAVFSPKKIGEERRLLAGSRDVGILFYMAFMKNPNKL